MAKLIFTVDPDAPKLKSAFSLIERDDYPMVIVKAELKELRSGPAIAAQIKISRGTYAGRYVFKNILIRHPDPIVQARGKAELNELCLALGIIGLKDTEELCGKEFIGLVYVTKPKDGFDAQNAVRSFRKMTVATSVDLLREKQLAEAKAEGLTAPQTAAEKARALLAGLKVKPAGNEPPF